MANITFTIPNAVIDRVLDAVAGRNGYTGVDKDGNPQTKTQFFKTHVIKLVKNEVKEYEGSVASVNAMNNAHTDVDTNIIIT